MSDEHSTNGVAEGDGTGGSGSTLQDDTDRRELSPISIEISGVADRLKSLAQYLYEITGDRDRIAYLALAAECLEIQDVLEELRLEIRARALRD